MIKRNTHSIAYIDPARRGHVIVSWGKQRDTWLPLVATIHFDRPGDARKNIHRGDWRLLVSTSFGGLHMQMEPPRLRGPK